MAESPEVLSIEISHLKDEMAAVKEEIKGLRNDFSQYLDKEAQRWQAWSEMHSSIQLLRNDLNIFNRSSDDHELRLRRIETWGFVAYGALTVIVFALNYFK